MLHSDQITTLDNETPLMNDGLPDDASRSDTDTSHSAEIAQKSVKRFPKPVTFTKYSVPKALTATESIKEKPASTTITASPQPAGRSRLVAKSTSALQQKPKTYRPSAPDPLQVWNKNRSRFT